MTREARQTDGTWQSSGSSSHRTYGSQDSSYSASGTYTYSLTGVSVSGTLSERGGEGWSSDQSTLTTTGPGGSVTSGSGFGGTHSSQDVDYSGSGSYSRSVTGGSLSGTITEGGSVGNSHTYGYTEAIVGGTWQLATGMKTDQSHDVSDWSYSGGGTYSLSSAGGAAVSWSLSGTLTEGRASGKNHQSVMQSQLQADGTWQTSGTASTADTGHADFSYSGSGTYSYSVGNATVSGTVTQGGGQGWSQNRWTNSAQVAGGALSTSGSGDGSTYWSNDFSYSGSGSYSYNVTGGSIHGTVEEGGGQGASYNYQYAEALSSGVWRNSTASVENGSHYASNWLYSGSGTYARGISGGTVSGTLEEDGADNAGNGSHSVQTLQADSTWQTSGSSYANSHSHQNVSYSGSGSYSLTVGNIGLAGDAQESGGVGWSNTTASQTVTTAGVSLTSGSGLSLTYARGKFSYSGSGAYASSAQEEFLEVHGSQGSSTMNSTSYSLPPCGKQSQSSQHGKLAGSAGPRRRVWNVHQGERHRPTAAYSHGTPSRRTETTSHSRAGGDQGS